MKVHQHPRATFAHDRSLYSCWHSDFWLEMATWWAKEKNQKKVRIVG